MQYRPLNDTTYIKNLFFQEKIQKEIDHVMGSVSYHESKTTGRKVSLSDRQWMP